MLVCTDFVSQSFWHACFSYDNFLTPTWSFDEIVSTILESNVILPKNPEKAANKPDTTENFSPAIFSMKISQVRFSLHKIIFHEINQYHFFSFLLEVCLHFISYRSVSRCGRYHPAEIVDMLSKQSICKCYQMLCYVWAFYKHFCCK